MQIFFENQIIIKCFSIKLNTKNLIQFLKNLEKINKTKRNDENNNIG